MGSFSKEPVHIVLDKDANTVCKSLGRTNPANVFKSTSYSRIPGIISKLQRPGEQLQSSAHYAVSILTQALSTLEKWAPLGTQYQFDGVLLRCAKTLKPHLARVCESKAMWLWSFWGSPRRLFSTSVSGVQSVGDVVIGFRVCGLLLGAYRLNRNHVQDQTV